MASASLSTRLFLVLTACITAALSLSTFVDYQWARTDILAQVEQHTETTIIDTINDMDTRIIGVESASALFASFLTERPAQLNNLPGLLQQMLVHRRQLFGASIAVDPAWTNQSEGFAPYYFRRSGGELVYRNLAESMDYANQPWFLEARAKGQPVWSEPYYDEGGGETLMSTYAIPLYRTVDGVGRFFGVLTADLALEDLSEQMKAFQLGDSGVAFLLSHRGNILAAPRSEQLMKPIHAVWPAETSSPDWEDLLSRSKVGQQSRFETPCPALGGNCVVLLSPLASNGWPLGVIYSEYEMLAPLREELMRLLITGLLGIALVAIAVAIISRRLTRPLTSLVSFTDNVAAGNLEAPMPKVKRDDEIGRLIASFSAMQQRLWQEIESLKDETANRNRIQGELDAAADIQLAMLPDGGNSEVHRKAYSLWARQRPAKTVGGDLYVYFQRSENELVFAVGDVSDKGVPAALFMARVVTVLDQQLNRAMAPSTKLELLNNELARGNDNCMFVTLFYGVLNLETLELAFASAGHTPPSLLRDGACVSIEQNMGPAMALRASLSYPNNTLQLKAGDTLAVYTDGIDEAFNPNQEQFTSERFNALLEKQEGAAVAAVGESVFTAVDEYAQGFPQSDDMTCLILSIPAPASNQLILDEHTHAISKTLSWLQQRAEALAIAEDAKRDLLLIAEEVVSNIYKYAEVSDSAKVEIELVPSAQEITLRVTDPGCAFNPLTESEGAELGKDSADAAIGGLGVHLVKALTDRQHYRRDGNNNVLEMTKIIG